MSDDFDVLTRLLDYHDHIAAPTVPVTDDVRRGRRRIARRRTLATGGVALALAGVVLTASVMTGGDRDTSPEPAVPSPTETATDIPVDARPERGRITSAQRYLGANASDYQWRAFDPLSKKGLFVSSIDGLESLTVLGPTGPLATLTCAQLRCPREQDYISYAATLGPGADEVTIESDGLTAQVIGYDGTVRRSLDLTAGLPSGEEITHLAWSSDGRRLAVVTGASGLQRDVWLVEDGGEPQLAYTGRVWKLGGWSPDGQSLLVDEYVGQSGADVVVLRLDPDGSSDAVTPQTLYRSDRHFDWAGNVAWSPDGTRIAVRAQRDINEISAEDGTVLARHPHRNGWLIWLARER